MLMPGWFGYGVAGIGVMHRMMLMRGGMFRPNVRLNMGGGWLVHEAGRDVAERQRRTRREHAKQIQQSGKPPGFGTRWSRQANEHGEKVVPTVGSAKAWSGAVPPHLHAHYRGIVA